jgi:hypothetical protein
MTSLKVKLTATGVIHNGSRPQVYGLMQACATREVPAHVNISEKLEVGLALDKAYAAEQRRSSQECLYPHGN